MISNSRQLKYIIGFTIIVFLSTTPLTAGAASQVILSGKFEGRSDHFVSGSVSVMRTDSGFLVVLEKDFSLDNAPDPKLGFGKNGYIASSQFSVLKVKTGAQVYALPTTIKPASYNEFWVWCEKHNVPLGVAKLHQLVVGI